MKTSIVLLTTAIAIIAACCAPNSKYGRKSHPRTWVLNFNDPTFVNLSAFTAALDQASDRIENITIKESPSATPYSRPVVSHPPSSLPVQVAPPLTYPKSQGPNTASLHVTQKVTLFTDEDAHAVMKRIQVP